MKRKGVRTFGAGVFAAAAAARFGRPAGAATAAAAVRADCRSGCVVLMMQMTSSGLAYSVLGLPCLQGLST